MRKAYKRYDLGKGRTITYANYYENKKTEAILKATTDLVEGGITIAAGFITEQSSFGLTSSASYVAVAYGADQFFGGAYTFYEIASGKYKDDDNFDNRPIRNLSLLLLGKEGGVIYDLGNVVVNTKGVLTINDATKEVFQVFNEISRTNSAISVRDGIISIQTSLDQNQNCDQENECDDKR